MKVSSEWLTLSSRRLILRPHRMEGRSSKMKMRARGRLRWLGLVALAAGVFVTVLDQTVLTVAVPTLMRDLHTNLAGIEWVIAGYSLAFASLLILSGRI